jgi:4-hydroxy-2-oxoglutarate aldolase
MTEPKVSLHGVFTPIVTSFDEGGAIAHDRMAENLRRWNQTGLKGYIVLGSNGEWVFLDERERLEVLKTARAAVGRDRLLIAGAAAESTAQTIALTEAAAAIGADAVIIVNPSYYRVQMTPAVLLDYYTAVADRSPVPVVVYNLPPATGIDLPADLLVELSHHANIIGVKDTGGDVAKMGEVLRRADPSFQVLAGSAGFFYPSQAIGVTGGVLALGNIAPVESVALFDLFHGGQIDAGRELHLRMLPVNAAVTARFGVAGLKAAMDMLGYYGGPPRSPLKPLDEQGVQELRSILRQSDILPAS